MRHVYVTFFFLACAMAALAVHDASGTSLLVAHLLVAAMAVTMFIGTMHMRGGRR